MGSVSDITDDELLGRAVRSVEKRGSRKVVAVMDMFGLGSTYAHQLCHRYGVDPDEMKGRVYLRRRRAALAARKTEGE